jgi:DNA-binding IclR family transcriptional regulator
MLVKQAANVLDLMEFFARRKTPATLSEISQEFGWPRSSTFNIVGTLVERGFLYEPVPRDGYYPTPRWLVLAQEIAAAEPLPADVHKFLHDLMSATGETAFIAAPAGTSAVLLDVVETNADIRYFARIGKRVPIQATAAGRAILSQYGASERASVLKKVKFERYQSGSLMSVKSVEDDIAQSIARGWFESIDGFTKDLAGVAMPLPVQGRRLSVVVGGPTFRITPRMALLGKVVRDATKKYLAAK